MINVYVYLDSQKDARQLVMGLMESDLIAHASIDKDNHSFIKVGNQITEQTNYVITGQSKALLFNDIVKYVEAHGKENIKIFSLPVTQCNENFSEIIRTSTKKI